MGHLFWKIDGMILTLSALVIFIAIFFVS